MSKEDAIQFFAQLFHGEHHIPHGSKGVKEFGAGWCVNTSHDFATFDSNELTRLVFMAHDRAVRVEIRPASPQYLKICIWQRQRDGDLYHRHPTLEQGVAQWREKHQPV